MFKPSARVPLLLWVGVFLCAACRAHLHERVEALERDLSDLRKTQALLSAQVRQVDRLNQSTYLLQDQLEKLGLELQAIQKELEELKSRFRVVEAATFQPAPRSGFKAQGSENQELQEEGGGESQGSSSSPDPRTLYQQGYRSMEGGRYEEALSRFRKLVESFPDHELADNAYYWMGEVYLKLEKREEAEKAFQAILERYSGGNKVPDALYKLAIIALDKGNTAGARAYLERILKEYPWSPVTDKARKKLESLPP